MKSQVRQYVERITRERRIRRSVNALLAALSVLVAVAVFWQLHDTGMAMVNETFCGEEEHQHDESCQEETVVCGEEEDPEHTHTEACYETTLTCEMPEHTHTADCLMDETADVETAADWEATLPPRGGTGAADVVAIAQSQIGYTESRKNFRVAEDGGTHMGYTRYGAWYGNPYGDWDAMFASFCLNYAGISQEAFPISAGAYAWTAALAERGLYADTQTYQPAAGDLLFLDRDGDGRADYVGVLAQKDEENGIFAMIAGDSHDAVEELTVSRGQVLGYGVVAGEETPPLEEEFTELTQEEEEAEPEEEETPRLRALSDTLDRYLEVFWTDGSVTYIQGRDDAAILTLTGTWTFGFRLDTVRDEVFLENGTYSFPLILPEEEVQFALTGGSILTEEGTVEMGAWEIAGSVLTITVAIPPEAVDAMGGIVRQEVMIGTEGTGGDQEAAQAKIVKTGTLSGGSQSILWTLSEVTIPRWDSSLHKQTASVWYIDDQELLLGDDIKLNNDMADLEIRMQSAQFPEGDKLIPLVGEAGAEDPIACAIQQKSDSEVQLYFLNRCSCTEENCPNYTTECGNTRDRDGNPYTGADGTLWCSCWHYPYNAIFTITYAVDASAIWAWQAHNAYPGISSIVLNTATLYQDSAIVARDNDMVTLEPLLSKTEVLRPADHDGIGTYQILINENGYSYQDTDCIVLTDTMENLALLVDEGENPTVTANGRKLRRIDEESAAGMGREGNEDSYYSVSSEDTFSAADAEEKTGEILTIKIWYPTSQTYRIEYEATVIACTQENQGDYSNTASIRDVSVSIDGTMRDSDCFASWYAYGKKLLLTKTDADSGEPLSEGAKFAFYRCGEDGEDCLLNTLTTDQTGKLEFHTDRSRGYVLTTNRLYCAVETAAPEGYDKSDRRYYFYFSEDEGDPVLLPEGVAQSDVSVSPVDEDGNAVISLTVDNQKQIPTGPLLPTTGGAGSARLAIIGAALLLGAFLLLMRRRIRRFARRLLPKFR